MKRLVLALTALMTLGASIARAAPRAGERALQLVRSEAKTCVDRAELRSALEKSGVAVVVLDGTADPEFVQVVVRGEPEHLTVHISGGGHDENVQLERASCQTATDLTAAFLISTLAPAAALPAALPAPPRLQASALERAIGDELARRGLQLTDFTVLLSLRRDRSDSWFAQIRGKDEPSVVQTIALGNFDDPSPERVAAVYDSIALAIRDVSLRQRLAPPSLRQTQLFGALDDVDLRARVAAWTGGFELALGAVALGALIPGHAPNAHFSFSRPADAFASAGASFALLAGAASFFVDDDYRGSWVAASGYATLGSGFSTVAFSDSSLPRSSLVAPAVGSYATAVLLGLNAALRRAPVSRLRAARRELASRNATSAEMDGIERELTALDPSIPAWLTYSPAILGGAIATLPALAHGFSNESRLELAIAGGGLLSLGLLSALLPTCAERYQNARRKSVLSDMAIGPTLGAIRGIEWSGRF